MSLFLLQPWENPPMGFPVPEWAAAVGVSLIAGLISAWMVWRWRK